MYDCNVVHPTEPGILHEVGERVASLTYESVPESRWKQTKLHVLDTLGCMIFATRLPIAGPLRC